MFAATIVCIVEGHGEVHAVPKLLHRLAAQIAPGLQLHVPHPIRRSRDKLLQVGELEKDVEFASYRIDGPGAILILIDSEGDCPGDLGPVLLERARAVRGDLPILVVLAHCEYESWFLAAAGSIAGKRGIDQDFAAPPNVEEIRGAKERITRAMTGNQVYSETADQVALTSIMDLQQARVSLSFDRLYRKCEELLASLTSSSASR